MSRVVTGTWVNADGTPRHGSVSFTPTLAASNLTDDEVLLPAPSTVALDATGSISVTLECTDDANWSGFEYRVVERLIGGREFVCELPSGVGAIDFTDLVALEVATDYAAYALATDLTAHISDTTSVHGIANTANLMLTGDAPTAHAASHAAAGGDALTLTQAQVTDLTSDLAGKVAKSTLDANTILKADTDDTPVALTVGASTIVGRKATGGIAALTGAEVAALLSGINPSAVTGTAAILGANTFTGAQLLVASATTEVPLTARGMAAQTGNLLEAKNSAGTVLASISAAGLGTFARASVVSGTLTDGAAGLIHTATLPSSQTGNQSAFTNTVTGAGTAYYIQSAFTTTLAAGYTGARRNFGLIAANSSAGSGTNPWAIGDFNGGAFGYADATTAGHNVGVRGNASGGNLNAGIMGSACVAKNSATNIGVAGIALNTGTSPVQIGGFFALTNTTPPALISAALMCDNIATTSPIFVARDNGAAVFTIAAGGVVTSTGPIFTPAATTSIPSVRLPHGTAPTSPTDGDMWTTTAGVFARINGTTVQLATV